MNKQVSLIETRHAKTINNNLSEGDIIYSGNTVPAKRKLLKAMIELLENDDPTFYGYYISKLTNGYYILYLKFVNKVDSPQEALECSNKYKHKIWEMYSIACQIMNIDPWEFTDWWRKYGEALAMAQREEETICPEVTQ